MKKSFALLSVLCLSSVILSGCVDPLTRVLDRYQYAAIVPVTKTQHLGDIYDSPGLNKPPFLLLREFPAIVPPATLEEIMKQSRDSVVIPDYTGEEKFDLSAAGNIPGWVKAELKRNKVSSYKIKFFGAHQYLVSEVKYRSTLYPMIKKIIASAYRKSDRQQLDLAHKYTVVALLQVDRLEYEFYSKDGTKITLEPGSRLAGVLKDGMGAEWSTGENVTLSFKSPKFIGLRMARFVDDSAGSSSSRTKSGQVLGSSKTGDGAPKLQAVPVSELRRALESPEVRRSFDSSGL